MRQSILEFSMSDVIWKRKSPQGYCVRRQIELRQDTFIPKCQMSTKGELGTGEFNARVRYPAMDCHLIQGRANWIFLVA